MNEPIQDTSDAHTEDALKALAAALEDPDMAAMMRDVRRHLGSFTFDPVGTLDED